uniref:Pseudouridine-5'-phosphatase n=1 Tax=Anopheles atroparvus TaxID=41427 RepID=A0AAG5CXI8_ANOAO
MSQISIRGLALGAASTCREMSSSPSSAFRKVTHCIFDMDGLLLDTEKIYENIFRTLLKSYNSPYPAATRLKVMGTTEQRSCSILVNDLKLPCTVEEFLVQFRRDQLLQLGHAPLMKGAERLVRHLHQHNIPIALATSSGSDSVEVKTKNHRELFELFGHKVMGSSDPDVKEGKPAPDIFLVAASRFPDPPEPTQCLVFEDAPNGVTAAIAAGMQAVMVPDPNIGEDQRKHATLVLRSLEDFRPEQFGLPAFA